MNEEECFVLSQSWFHLMLRENRRVDTSASFNFESCSQFQLNKHAKVLDVNSLRQLFAES